MTQINDKSWQEIAQEAQREREELRCKTVEQAGEIEVLRRLLRTAVDERQAERGREIILSKHWTVEARRLVGSDQTTGPLP